MFKIDWEKTSSHSKVPQDIIEKMIQTACPDQKLLSHELIAGGCANLNYKIILADSVPPLLLRIYLRDKKSAYIEQQLGTLLKNVIPIPQTYSLNEMDGYLFCTTQFMPGIPLRDLLLSATPHDLSAIMYNVGTILSKIIKFTPPDPHKCYTKLNEDQGIPEESIKQFSRSILNHPDVIKFLSQEMRESLQHYVEQLPDYITDQKNLVHADFDPANILVNQQNGQWNVSAILDWEFSYAGSWTDDVATILRYRHKMPPLFQEAFFKGLTDHGIDLPKNLDLIIDQYNIAALLDAITRHPLNERPNIYRDIIELLENILSKSKAIPNQIDDTRI